MFVRDDTFLPTSILDGRIVWTGDTRNFSATVRYDGGFREANLTFNARLCSDGHWRVRVTADRLPSVGFTGVGDPLIEFIDFHHKFVTYFAGDRKVLPWEALN